MEADSEKLCLDELDHLILDAGKKITLTHISNNWNMPSKNGEIVFEKWLKNYSGDKKIAKEYLIRGTDVNGNTIITIVPEKTLPKIDKICPNHTRTLYSVEIESANGRSLNIPEPSTNKYIALKAKSDKRNIAASKIVVPPKVKQQPDVAKKPANPFGVVQSKPQPVRDLKNDNNSASNSKGSKVKEEKTSPKKSPKKNDPPAKSAKGQQGKSSSSIASFFASKSSASCVQSTHDKSVLDAASKIEKVKIKDEPIKNEVENGTATTSKRHHSNASDSAEDSKVAEKNQTAPAKKKIKLEPKSARSRLMQICDSSSDEDDASDKKDVQMESETVVKKEKENKTPSPEKTDMNRTDSASTDSRKRRAKVKKMVTRTYEDEDGFINTVREMEEVSCSEEEPEVVLPPPKKIAAVAPSNSKSTKKKVSPPTSKKQGSILNFLTKK